jgi:uncharacterized protein YciI
MSSSVARRRRPGPFNRLCWLATLLACDSSDPAPSNGHVPSAGAVDPSYLVVYRPGPGWPSGGAMPPELRAHFRYLLGLHQRGTLQLAGPFGGEPGGAAVLRARDDDAARALVQADPAVTAQVFDVQLRRWGLVDWSAHAQQPAQ